MNTMQRLRTARPPSAKVTVDRDALFASIVASASRPAEGRDRRRPRRKLVVVTVVAAVAVLAAGSTLGVAGLLGWHTDNSLVSNPREWRALYRAATRELTLPPGVKWPYRTLAPNNVTSRDYPGGMAVGISQIAWECYWVGAIRTDNVAGQHRAQSALADIVRHHIAVAPPGSPENVAPPATVKPPFEIYASDGGLQADKHMYAEAAAGNPAGIAQSCRANGPIS
jgi:hypothetical protein